MSDKITKRTQADKEFLLNQSVAGLPDNPSNHGFSASQIKNKMYKPSVVLFEWLKLLTEETSAGFAAYDENIDETVREASEVYFSSKLDKITGVGNYVYTHNGQTQGQIEVGVSFTKELAVVQRDVNGQIEVPYTPTQTYHAASKSYVAGVASALEEKIEGRTLALTLSYNDTIATVKTALGVSGPNRKALKFDGTDITDDILDGDYDSVTLVNSSFNSNNASITLTSTSAAPKYIICKHIYGWANAGGGGGGGGIIPGFGGGGGSNIATSGYNIIYYVDKIDNIPASMGDVFWVIETDVPDRWVEHNVSDKYYVSTRTHEIELYKMETQKVPLEDYHAKNASVVPSTTGLNVGSSDYPYSKFYADDEVIIKGNSNFVLKTNGYNGVLGLDSVNSLEFGTGAFWTNVLDFDLGTSSHKWRDLYLAGKVIFDTNYDIEKSGNLINVVVNGGTTLSMDASTSAFGTNVRPMAHNTYDLGTSSAKWKDVYMSGKLNMANSVVKDFIKLTQAEYDALVSGGTIDNDTFYFIEEE